MRVLTLLLSLTLIPQAYAGEAKAWFAGGCFWCMESDYEEREGVIDVVSGFTGGTLQNPTYRGNHEGHFEAVEVTYDPSVISYKALLDLYWVNIDPFDDRGQFCDKGHEYRSAIFVLDSDQRRKAEASKADVQARFGLGYAPGSRNALKEHLAGKGFERDQVETCGLVVHGEDIAVSYDRFRDRVMFPILDARERVIAAGPMASAIRPAAAACASDRCSTGACIDTRNALRSFASRLSPITRGSRPALRASLTAATTVPASASASPASTASITSSSRGTPPAATTWSSAESVSRAEPPPTRTT